MRLVCTAREAGSAQACSHQKHYACQAWQASVGFTFDPSDPSTPAAALPPPEGPPPTARDARAHRTRTADCLRGGTPHVRAAGRPGQRRPGAAVSLGCNG